MQSPFGKTKQFSKALSVFVFSVSLFVFGANVGTAAAATTFRGALCQVVYSLDQYPGASGYHYVFFGNGFFINNDGYLITAAHVLSAFRDGGQPRIIVGPPQGPRRLLDASIVAADWAHDVAVLRAEPNPFADASFKGERNIAYLPLSTETPAPGKTVVSDSLRSPDVENASSTDAPDEEPSTGEVLTYQFRREEGTPDTEVLLVSQEVLPGQSGSPLVSDDSQGVVGVIVGRWVGPVVAPSGANGRRVAVSSGVALRIHYAISLLQENHVAWYAAAAPAVQVAAAAPQAAAQSQPDFVPPEPLSVVGTPYPPQALFGGEVLLDALIDTDGKPSDIRVVSGQGSFLDVALSSVRTWSFLPAKLDGRAVEARIGIVFQFPQSFLPKVTSGDRKYDEPLANSPDHGALPVETAEPVYPANSVGEGSVVLYGVVDAQGRVTNTEILRDVGSLTAPTENALDQFVFEPGRRAGADAVSGVVVVATFRRPAL